MELNLCQRHTEEKERSVSCKLSTDLIRAKFQPTKSSTSKHPCEQEAGFIYRHKVTDSSAIRDTMMQNNTHYLQEYAQYWKRLTLQYFFFYLRSDIAILKMTWLSFEKIVLELLG